MRTMIKQLSVFVLPMYAMATSAFSQHAEKTYILVHSQWHGSWAYNKIVPILEKKGYRAIAPDLPGHGADPDSTENVTFADCVDRVVSVANAQQGQVILVGHSSGSAVIAQASERLGKSKVASIVCIDGFLPNDGESIFSLAEKYASSGRPLSKIFRFSSDNKTVSLDLADVKELLYHDCLPEDVNYAKSHLRKSPLSVLATPVKLTSANYGSIPKFYILCTEARDMKKTELSKNVVCKKVYTLPSGHMPQFSMPEKLTEILMAVY